MKHVTSNSILTLIKKGTYQSLNDCLGIGNNLKPNIFYVIALCFNKITMLVDIEKAIL